MDEDRLAMLEYKIELLTALVDPDRNPFVFLCLEEDVTREQKKQLMDLMEDASISIREDKPMSHHEFENRVYSISPKHHGDYHFAEAIVSTLNDTHRWRDVYEYMKHHGMNLS